MNLRGCDFMDVVRRWVNVNSHRRLLFFDIWIYGNFKPVYLYGQRLDHRAPIADSRGRWRN